MRRPFLAAAGVSYLSLVLTHFKLLKEPREALCDLASEHLPELAADKFRDLAECPYCLSWHIALIVSKGNPIKATQLAGLASIPTSLVLLATRG